MMRTTSHHRLCLVLFCACTIGALPVLAAAAVPDCEALAAEAGAAAGLPDGLLPAIARVESGRGTAGGGTRAWPWTLNNGGNGTFDETEAEALLRLEDYLAAGVQNVDLGCMQLNWRWHAAAFDSAADMIDPVANTQYAARFLLALHDELGSWEAAIAHYHSREEARGTAYAAKVAAVMQGGLSDAPLSFAVQKEDWTPRLAGLLALPSGPLVGAERAENLRHRKAPGLFAPPMP